MTTPQVYYNQALTSLDEHNLASFMESIGAAKVLAVTNNPDLLPGINFLKIKGLFKLKEYQILINSITEALTDQTGNNLFKLQCYYGLAQLYTGQIEQALVTMTKAQQQAAGSESSVEGYLNIVMGYICQYITTREEAALDQCKHYLDLIEPHLPNVSNMLRYSYCNNYGVYYFHRRDLENSLQYIREAVQYCPEHKLPSLYNNLSDVLLKADPDGLPVDVEKYTNLAETIGLEHKDYTEVGRAFYLKAQFELRDDQLGTALDSLYMAFEYFKTAQALKFAIETLEKIQNLLQQLTSNEFITIGGKIKN